MPAIESLQFVRRQKAQRRVVRNRCRVSCATAPKNGEGSEGHGLQIFPQFISPQSSASDRRLPLARVLCPLINTCLPHAPPAGHWSSLALVPTRANGFCGDPMAWPGPISGADTPHMGVTRTPRSAVRP